MTAHDIQLSAVTFAFPSVEMRFDALINPSAITIVAGPSGSGKSTLLNLIAGFETPLSGTIKLAGEDVTNISPAKRPVSMLFQENNLFNHLTVEANVSLGARPNLKLSADEKVQVSKALNRVGLEGKANRLPTELSGGERQRVAFARILVLNRPVLLLDEPFASLGPALRREMIDLLAELQHEKQLTVLAITHHPIEWNDVAENFVFVEDGHIAAYGPIGDMQLPNAALKSYLG